MPHEYIPAYAGRQVSVVLVLACPFNRKIPDRSITSTKGVDCPAAGLYPVGSGKSYGIYEKLRSLELVLRSNRDIN